MTPKSGTLLASCLVALTLAAGPLAQAASAQPPGGPGGPGHGRGGPPAGAPGGGGHHGPGGHRRGGPGRGEGLEVRVARMTEHLGLDPAQAAAIRQVLAQAHAQHEALRQQPLPEAQRRAEHHRIMTETHPRLRAVLRADQQRIFDAHLARRQARMEARRGEHADAPDGRRGPPSDRDDRDGI